MTFILGLAAIATAASAAMAYQQARGQAQAGQMMSELNNKTVLENYRRNIEKLSLNRVESRKIALGQQAAVSKQYNKALRSFEGAFADNWGASAHAYAVSIARAAGEDAEQITQNLQREVQRTEDIGEEQRLALFSQLTTPPPDTSRAVLVEGLISTGVAFASLPSQIKSANAQQKIQDYRIGKIDAENALAAPKVVRVNKVLTSTSTRVSQFNRLATGTRQMIY